MKSSSGVARTSRRLSTTALKPARWTPGKVLFRARPDPWSRFDESSRSAAPVLRYPCQRVKTTLIITRRLLPACVQPRPAKPGWGRNPTSGEPNSGAFRFWDDSAWPTPKPNPRESSELRGDGTDAYSAHTRALVGVIIII